MLRIAHGWEWWWGKRSLRQLYRNPGRDGGHDQEVGVKVGPSPEIFRSSLHAGSMEFPKGKMHQDSLRDGLPECAGWMWFPWVMTGSCVEPVSEQIEVWACPVQDT